MKKTVLTISLLAFLRFAAGAAAFTAGDLLVVRVGDGSSALVNSAGPLSLLEVSAVGSLAQPALTIPSGNGGLQISGTATSEGALVRNADNSSWTLAGYVPPFGGSGSLSGRSAANAPRGYLTLSSAGSLSSAAILPGSTTYSAQNIRSGFASGSGLWFTGSGTAGGSGIVYDDGSTSTTIQGINSRVLGSNNGDLFYSTGSGTQGIYKFSGTPTSPTSSAAFLTGIAGQGTSPYDFVFSPDGNSLYVADDAIGVQKFSFNGSSWSLAYNFTSSASANKAYGLAVDFSGASPVVFWTSPTDVWSAIDTGAAGTGASILSAGANYAFRGLDSVPVAVPEPSVLALVGLGFLFVFTLVRRSRAQGSTP